LQEFFFGKNMMNIQNLSLSWIYWNPDRDAFTIPILDHPVRWYGICFALGFIIGYWIFFKIISNRLSKDNIPNSKELATTLTDKLLWFVIGGAVIGARLGHVFFYEWPRYSQNPLDILKIWEGGLASHGGTIGILISLFFYKKLILKNYKEISYIDLLDMLCIPVAFGAGFCIRIGNFINQEILGKETSMPWGVIFGNPADGSSIVSRHPVQLYEAFAGLLTFIVLFSIWKMKSGRVRRGVISGLFFIMIFGSRFIFEFFKLPSSLMIDESWLQTGQILSVPCILVGFLLLAFGNCNCNKMHKPTLSS
jgi:prolipoprotein diacylglyceryl transferase